MCLPQLYEHIVDDSLHDSLDDSLHYSLDDSLHDSLHSP